MDKTISQLRAVLLHRAQDIIGKPLGSIDKTNRLQSGKGAIGTVIEESWFGYSPNSESEPDFIDEQVELKVTPYIKTQNGSIRAKERLVCNIINYMEEYNKEFETSSFWHKCNTMLIMAYEHKYDVPKSEYSIDAAILFSFPEEDLIIIQQDWEKIISKIRSGQAHLISEGDTLYLAACTKGVNSSSVRQQPFSQIPAKQRAYSLKSSYMSHIFQDYIFGNVPSEHIIHNWQELVECSLENYIINKVQPYYGMTQHALIETFDIAESSAKNINEILLGRMLGVKGKIAYTDEFQKANIIPKTIRVKSNGHIVESMSFPTFDFIQICNETWEDSTFYNYLAPAKFLFVVFQENDSGEYYFSKIQFWNIIDTDLEEVHKVWEKTVNIIKSGIKLTYTSSGIKNNLPKKSENRVCHVRPHGKDSSDTLPLPDGRQMTKQCFWLNNTFIEEQLKKH